MATTEIKPWYKSKTKWAGIMAGVLIVLNSIPAWLNGGAFPATQVLEALTAVFAVFGIRDLPIINK